jgi:hypothetical protein
MAKKKPAKPAKKTTARKAERSKGELSSDDLESVSGGIIVQAPALSAIQTPEIKSVKIAPGALGLPGSSIKLEP